MKDLSIDKFVDLIFNKICIFTGVKFNSSTEREESAAELIEMLFKNYPEKYVNEIVGSYFLADKKRFFDENGKLIELFRMIDYRQCSDLIQLFDSYFKKIFSSELKSQKFWFEPEVSNEPTKEEIEASFNKCLKDAIEAVKIGNSYNVAGSDLFLYQELKNRGKFNYLTESDKEKYFSQAKKKRRSDLLAEKLDKNTSFGRKSDISRLIENILDDDVIVLNIGRRMILNDYLKLICNENLKI